MGLNGGASRSVRDTVVIGIRFSAADGEGVPRTGVSMLGGTVNGAEAAA